MRSISTYADVVDARAAGELSPGDEELLRNCKAGNPTVLNGGKRPLAQSPATTVHAQVLRYVIMGGCDDWPTHEWGVDLYGAYIEDPLDLRRFSARGVIGLMYCHIPECIHAPFARMEVLNLNGSQISGLNAQGASIQSDVFMRGVICVSDEIRLSSAEIGGQLELSGARLSNVDGYTLMAQGTKIGGSIHLSDNFFSSGEVLLQGAEITGQLNCSGAHLKNSNGNSLNLDGAKITGSFLLINGFKALGKVTLNGMRIGAQLSFSGSKILNSGKDALMAQDISCGSFFWKGIKSIDGHVSLIGARCKNLVDDVESWRNTSSYALNGFTYGRISGFTEVKTRLDWVNKGAFDNGSFSPHPYEQLAQIYGEMGHSADRREVLIAKETEYWKFERQILRSTRRMGRAFVNLSHDLSQESFAQIKTLIRQQPEFDQVKFERVSQKFRAIHPKSESQNNSWQMTNAQAGFREEIFWQNGKIRARIAVLHLQDWVPRLLVGYGYRPFRVLWILAFLWITASVLAYRAWDGGDFAPNSDVILSTKAWQDLAEDPLVQNPAAEWSDTDGKGRDYETFSALAYGFDVVVPIVTIGQEAAWAPSTARGTWTWGWWLWWARWFLSVLGWIVTAVGAAAITGIIRRE